MFKRIITALAALALSVPVAAQADRDEDFYVKREVDVKRAVDEDFHAKREAQREAEDFYVKREVNEDFYQGSFYEEHATRGVRVWVAGPYLELYTFPGRGFPRFHALEKGESMRLTKRRNDWFKVVTDDGKEGWVKRADLTDIRDEDGTPLAFPLYHWSDTRYRLQAGLMVGELEGVKDFTMQAGWRFTPNLAVELRYAQAFGDYSIARLGTLAVVHQAFPHWRVSPFFVLGAGQIQVRPSALLEDEVDRDDTALTVGGGVMVYLTHRLMLRLEYNQHSILTTQEFNQEVDEWKGGISVLF